LPDRRAAKNRVKPCAQKYFCFSESKIHVWSAHPASIDEGRIAVVTTREAEMQWTRDVSKTNDADADGEVVWSWRALAGVKSATMLTLSRRRRWQTLVHRGEHV
jgi:hypothetical protein